ncbi:MAG: ABC transporter ATP-binding protein [Deltaproteobacteria bacterium]|nr:ABC transporter ATP-binding protein [Deltaproteobacteria bacterium]
MRAVAGQTGLLVRGVSRRFGDVVALDRVDLDVAAGEFATLLGPSGCGKTTLLRILAGFELQDSGTVSLGGSRLDGRPAHERPVNTVFQSYALFPHLDVRRNVAFGLVAKKTPKAEVDRRADEAIAMLRLEEMAARLPHQLSGGQRQRVALARALVNEPELLLLDEPMSALDARLRTDLQLELRALQRRLGKTFVLVTHDQDEAMTVSDRIFVMDRAKVVQFGSPSEVYDHPKTKFVATFLGSAALIASERSGDRVVKTSFGELFVESPIAWDKGTLAIRPERIRLRRERPERNGIEVTISDRVYLGDHVDLVTDVAGLSVRVGPSEAVDPGTRVHFELPPEHLEVLVD